MKQLSLSLALVLGIAVILGGYGIRSYFPGKFSTVIPIFSASEANLGSVRKCLIPDNLVSPSAEECVRGAMQSLLKSSSARELMAGIRSSPDRVISKKCHTLGHILGRELYKKVGSLPEAISQCDATLCMSGCAHGAVAQSLLAELGVDFDIDLVHSLATLAAGEKIDQNARRYCDLGLAACHAVGHAAFLSLGGYGRSLALCDRVPGRLEKESCYRGVFMESFGLTLSGLVESRPIPDPKEGPGDYGFPCREIGPAYQHACFQYLPWRQRVLFQRDKVADDAERLMVQRLECERMDGFSSRSACFEGLGHMYAAKEELVLSFCNGLAESVYRQGCILGMITSMGNYRNHKNLANFCGQVSDPAAKKICYQKLFQLSRAGDGKPKTLSEICGVADKGPDCAKEYQVYEAGAAKIPEFDLGVSIEKND